MDWLTELIARLVKGRADEEPTGPLFFGRFPKVGADGIKVDLRDHLGGVTVGPQIVAIENGVRAQLAERAAEEAAECSRQ